VDQFGQTLIDAVAAEQAQIDEGRLAVIVPRSRYAELTALLSAALPGIAFGSDPALLDASTAILTVDQSKGLEFDSVLIADPGAILRDSARGGSDLYVAVTRATRRLGVIADGPLPELLGRHSTGNRSNAMPSRAEVHAFTQEAGLTRR
jgi:superfamily I DNA/RNA helicase